MILYFSAKNWNPIMCYNMVEHQKHYAQLKKSNKIEKQKNTCLVWFYL